LLIEFAQAIHFTLEFSDGRIAFRALPAECCFQVLVFRFPFFKFFPGLSQSALQIQNPAAEFSCAF
jgi:hypothetical protein